MTNDYGNLELHTVLLSAMKDIDKICRENGLRYYLYAGTLLGAVNYGGFIPWDDDVDIVMFPEDFQKLCQVIEEQYSSWYYMQTFDNTEDVYLKLNALRINGTGVCFSDNQPNRPFYIDIQVLHGIPNGRIQRFIQRKSIETINIILAMKSGELIPTSLVSRFVLFPMSRISKKFWGWMLDKIMGRYDHKRTEYVGIMCNTLAKNPYTGRSGYENDMTKRKSHESPVYIEFEDTQFLTFSDFDCDLSNRYGLHWREPYPEEKRTNKHGKGTYTISDAVRKRVGL